MRPDSLVDVRAVGGMRPESLVDGGREPVGGMRPESLVDGGREPVGGMRPDSLVDGGRDALGAGRCPVGVRAGSIGSRVTVSCTPDGVRARASVPPGGVPASITALYWFAVSCAARPLWCLTSSASNA